MIAAPICPSCGLPVPRSRDDVASLLARWPDGATTGEVAGVVRRRRADVLAELRRLEAAGLAERGEPCGRDHGRRWRLTALSGGRGTASERRTDDRPGSDSQPGLLTAPALPELVRALLARAGRSRSAAARVGWLVLAALAVVGAAAGLALAQTLTTGYEQ